MCQRIPLDWIRTIDDTIVCERCSVRWAIRYEDFGLVRIVCRRFLELHGLCREPRTGLPS
jgi:hypothetical protein